MDRVEQPAKDQTDDEAQGLENEESTGDQSDAGAAQEGEGVEPESLTTRVRTLTPIIKAPQEGRAWHTKAEMKEVVKSAEGAEELGSNNTRMKAALTRTETMPTPTGTED